MSWCAETWWFLFLFIWWEEVCYARQKIAQTFVGKREKKKKKERTSGCLAYGFIHLVSFAECAESDDISFPD